MNHEQTLNQLAKATGTRSKVRDVTVEMEAPKRSKSKGGAPRAGLR
jgi:hypothetical protein